jgi:glyoxylate/hydroxypyruvate reductase
VALLLTPISAPAAEWLRCFAAELPDLEVRVWPALGDPADIEIAAITRLPPGTLAKLPNLRLVISVMAGAEGVLGDKTLPAQVPVVRSSEPQGDALMNETALLHVLRHHRFLHEYVLAQQKHEWRPQRRLTAGDRTVGVMGLGMIGLPVATTLRDHGFKVVGWARTEKKVAGITAYHGRAQLADFLGRSEILVNLLALTPETENILCRAAFAQLPKGAAVINLARGPHVVDEDLIAALDSGHLAAATLDAFRVEPLPRESPLWAHPRITITPHVARRLAPELIVHRICENVVRLRRGEPLLYPVNREAGY